MFRILSRIGVGLALAWMSLSPGWSQSVVDGNTLRMDGMTYRLWGIDAPETRQICEDGWASGMESAHAIAVLIHGETVNCDPKMGERAGRTAAICWAGKTDLSAAMVLAGYALALRTESGSYLGQEAVARAAKRGLHAHHCETPWSYRIRVGAG